MVTHHVEERLEQRVVPATAESAYELLRDPAALATRVAAYFKQREQGLPARVALPLSGGEQPPLLVVTADGHGVTCLAAGMRFDGTVLPFSVVDAFRARQRDRLRRRMASQRLEALEAEGWDLNRTLDHAYRMTRVEFDRLVLVAPLLGNLAERSAETLAEHLGRRMRMSFRARHYPDPHAEAAWRQATEVGHLVMATAAEPGNLILAALASTMPDCHVATRGIWVLLNHPHRLIALCRAHGDLLSSGWAEVWHHLLEFTAMRFPDLREQALDARRHLPPLKAGELGTEAQVRRDMELELVLSMMESQIYPTVEPARRARSPADSLPAKMAQLAAQDRPFLPMVASFRGPWGQMLEDLDLWRDYAVIPPPRPRPLEALSTAEHARVCLWRWLLREHRESILNTPVAYSLLVGLAPREALVPDRDPDPAWTLSAGREYVRRHYPWFVDTGIDRTVRRDPAQPDVGPNAPCPCGSHKKFKKCCGAA